MTESICPYCAVGCGTVVHTRGDEIVDIEGNPRSPINQGTLCPKGANTFQYTVNPNRLTRVLYRRPFATEWEQVDLEWAMQQIADEQWANPSPAAASTAAGPAMGFEQPQAQPEAASQWAQAQPSEWDAYQQQAAQEQAAFDAEQARQAQAAAEAAQAQIQAHAEPVPEHPAFDPNQWAPPNPGEQAA